jgi:DME family drug/metabolite transporter
MIDAAARVSDRRLSRGYAIALTATAVWSTTPIFISYLTKYYGMPPLVLAFWRDLLVGLGIAAALAIVAPAMLRIERRHWRFLLLYGFILAVFNAMWTVAVALNGAAVATVLVYNSAAFTVVLAWRLFGEQLSGVKIVAVVLALIGCVLVAGAYDPAVWRLNPIGLITGLLSGLGFALYSIMGRAAARRNIPPWSTMFCTFLVGAGFLLVFVTVSAAWDGASAVSQLLWLGPSLAGWGILIVLALGPTAAGYGLYTVSLTYLPASIANLIATLEPAMTAVLAYFLLGEQLSPVQLVGSALILLGVVLVRVRS